MVTILDRYIAKTTIQATLFSLLILGGVMCLFTLLGEFKNIGEGDYGIIQAFFYVFLRLPNQLYQLSPVAILLGGVIGLSTLSSSRELSVMRISGFSTKRIVISMLASTLALMLFIGLIGEGVGPNWSYRAEVHKENAQNAGQAVVTASGVWFHVENNFIHVDDVINREKLEGVTRYEFNDQHQLIAAYYAKNMTYERDRWLMHNVVATHFNGDESTSSYIPLLSLKLSFSTSLLNVGLVDPNEMTLPRLTKFAHYLQDNGLQASEYQYEFWQRLFKPLAGLIMILIAVPFVLGFARGAPLGWRVLTGVCAGFIFFIGNAFFGQICMVYQVPPMIAALLPLLIFAGLGLYLTRHVSQS